MKAPEALLKNGARSLLAGPGEGDEKRGVCEEGPYNIAALFQGKGAYAELGLKRRLIGMEEVGARRYNRLVITVNTEVLSK